MFFASFTLFLVLTAGITNGFTTNADIALNTDTENYTRPDIIYDVNGDAINSTTVIVWEKCGVDAKTKVTKVFEGRHNHNEFSVSFDPTINALIFESFHRKSLTNTTILPLNGYVDTLFFTFQSGRLTVMTDCHNAAKMKVHWESIVLDHFFMYKIHNNVVMFPTLEIAQRTFRCRASIVISQSTILHLTGAISSIGNSLLFTFTHQSTVYSVSYKSPDVSVWSSNGEVESFKLNKPIGVAGLFIVFERDEVKFYTECPHGNEPSQKWETDMFKTNIAIETTKVHYIGSTVSKSFLETFCTTDKYINLEIKRTDDCIPVKRLSRDLELIQDSNKKTHYFLPTRDEMEKIELFDNLNIIKVGSIVTLVAPRLTIASRYYAKPRFFDRSLNEYINGFSDGNLNFWVGLDTILRATQGQKFGLRIEIENSAGVVYTEEYNNFMIGNASEKYALKLVNPRPGTQDFLSHNTVEFSTYDFGKTNLAQQYVGGFWFKPSSVITSPLVTHYYYCFTCENRLDVNGTATYYYRQSLYSHITRMQLLL